jgi:hypothetical protein
MRRPDRGGRNNLQLATTLHISVLLLYIVTCCNVTSTSIIKSDYGVILGTCLV